MHVRVIAALVALVACHPPARVPRPHDQATVTSAPAFVPESIERHVEEDDRQICGYAQMPSIPFERGSVLVTPDEDVLLQRLARCFTAPDMQSARIVLVGRAAEPAHPTCAAELGLERSERVKEFLVGHGVPSDRVDAVSVGDRETPLAIATPRVDFVLAFPKSGAHPVTPAAP